MLNPSERAKLVKLYLRRAAHFFSEAANEVERADNPFACPSIAHAMSAAMDAQAAGVGAKDDVDPKTIKTKEI